MSCSRCNSKRILNFSGKCKDLFSMQIGDASYDGYVPSDLGVGGGDYVEGDLCLDCGQLQGTWPLPTSHAESPEVEAVDDNDIVDPPYSGRLTRKRKKKQPVHDVGPDLLALKANMEKTKLRKTAMKIIIKAYKGK